MGTGPSAPPVQTLPSIPTATISMQICPLACWPHSLVLGSAPRPSPPWATVSNAAWPLGRENSPQGSLGQRVPLQLSPSTGVLLSTWQRPSSAVQHSAHPAHPSPLFQARPGPSPGSLPSGGRGALASPGQACHFITFVFAHAVASSWNALPHFQLWDPIHATRPSTEGPSVKPPWSPAASANYWYPSQARQRPLA